MFPRAANEIIRDQAKVLHLEVVGEAYLPLGTTHVQDAVGQIQSLRPDVVLNTINGDTNVAFFRALRAAGVRPESIPTLSFSLGESELSSMSDVDMVGEYAAWNYFGSLQNEANTEFLAALSQGSQGTLHASDPMEAAWTGVHLWAQAVREGGTAKPSEVRSLLRGRGMTAPSGSVWVDPGNFHLWKTARVGRVRADRGFEVLWEGPETLGAEPFPESRSLAEWEDFLEQLSAGWGGAWQAPLRGRQP